MPFGGEDAESRGLAFGFKELMLPLQNTLAVESQHFVVRRVVPILTRREPDAAVALATVHRHRVAVWVH